ncbi:uncharacterized protein LOC111380417 [Olea europaea var. sylvestris]|uniref:uncharacterized protein LOC111380417 n=1 Tax=Olea europaea var. sylvestris TaxID=158386 RepID=UPI000C1D6C9B|nr:uncharacterized protein LOC111380417 [Olea europaea var. sylvestris]
MEKLALPLILASRKLRLYFQAYSIESPQLGSYLSTDHQDKATLEPESSWRARRAISFDLVPHFERFELVQVLRFENIHVDALSKLASNKDSELLRIIAIKHLSKRSIFRGEEVMWIEGTPPWTQPIIAYLKDQSLPPSKSEAKKLRRRDIHFIHQNGMLYKRGFSSPILRCDGGKEAVYIMREIHKGVCGNHSSVAALTHKVLRQGYFWPNMKKDFYQFVQKCDKCQRFTNVQRQPFQELSVVTSL